MMEVQWILRETVFALQERLIADFGGIGGIRDVPMLDSALARPENRCAYSNPSVPELAAAYAFGLVKNYPFCDGNKRIAFAVAILFLELNGRSFHATEEDAVVKTLALAESSITEAEYAMRLEKNSREITGSG